MSCEHPVNTEAWGLSLRRWALSLQLGGATCCLHSTQFKTLHDCPLVVLPVSSAWPTLPCPPGPSTWLLMPNSSSFCPSVVAWPLLARGHHRHSFSLAGTPPPTLPVPSPPTLMFPSELPDSAKSPRSLLRAAWERSLVTHPCRFGVSRAGEGQTASPGPCPKLLASLRPILLTGVAHRVSGAVSLGKLSEGWLVDVLCRQLAMTWCWLWSQLQGRDLPLLTCRPSHRS